MRYSVANRFKGTLVGALVGETIGLSRLTDGHSVHWSQMAIAVAEVLIQRGKFDRSLGWQIEPSDTDAAASGTGIDILATLPISLFFHENTIQLRDNLLRIGEIWRDYPALQEGELALGYAIAQILNEVALDNLIEETIAFVNMPEGVVSQKLLTVSSLLKNSAGLETAQACFTQSAASNSIAMAFYCFLSTLEDFRLGTLRATNQSIIDVSAQRVAPGAIAGALLGAYNSITGIPVTWHLQPEASALKITSSRVMKLADVLAAMWSGVYDFNESQADSRELSIYDHKINPVSDQAIAAPRVIR